MDKYVGKRLDGRYEIHAIVGEGGMARVYKAYDNQENRWVAIKILKDEFLSNDEFVRRFKNESKAIAMLSHPNIVNVYDVSFGNVIQYIVMEYIEGITLKEYIENQGSLRWKDAVHFAMQILKGLQHAHDKGIVHRDVKPQNIMVLADGTIKVTDFGIARFSRSDQRTITDKAIGSVHYISPEQARGEKTDEKADIYSVGVMLYEMITGKLPFQAESAVSVAIMQLQRDPQRPTEINASIPMGLEQITMRAMQKSQDKRYQSASEMLCDLNNFKKDPAIMFPYNYFVDDSPTRFIGDDVTSTVVDTPKVEKTKKKQKGGILPILTGVSLALIIALLVLVVIFFKDFFKPLGVTIETPKFIGMKYEEIKNDSQYEENFNFIEKYEHNTEYPVGYVFKQSIKPGSKVKGDNNITLYISMGARTITVKDVYNKEINVAESELKGSGLKVIITEIPSDKVAKGAVIRTDPQRNMQVLEGSTITVYVSTGKPTKYVKVPDVTGQPSAQAEETLLDKKLMVTIEKVNIPWDESWQPKGNVVRQEVSETAIVDKDGKVAEGSEIILYVSTGKYAADITVSLPKQFADETCTLTLWDENADKKIAEITDINLTSNSKATFENIDCGVVSNKGTVKVFYIKIKSENVTSREYMTIKVNFGADSEDQLVTVLSYGKGFGN